MTLAKNDLGWYNNLPQHRILSFEKLANNFLDHLVINIRKRASIIDLSKLSQFDDESVLDYVSRWRVVMIDMPYSLPQEELFKLFFISCNKHTSSIL